MTIPWSRLVDVSGKASFDGCFTRHLNLHQRTHVSTSLWLFLQKFVTWDKCDGCVQVSFYFIVGIPAWCQARRSAAEPTGQLPFQGRGAGKSANAHSCTGSLTWVRLLGNSDDQQSHTSQHSATHAGHKDIHTLSRLPAQDLSFSYLCERLESKTDVCYWNSCTNLRKVKNCSCSVIFGKIVIRNLLRVCMFQILPVAFTAMPVWFLFRGCLVQFWIKLI